MRLFYNRSGSIGTASGTFIRCLEHVFAQSYPNIEVMVIDNGSRDGSLERVKARHGKRCKIYRELREHGYAVGMNQALRRLLGSLSCLNQDVCLHQDFVSECVRRILQDEKIGAIGVGFTHGLATSLPIFSARGREKSTSSETLQIYAGEWTETETLVFGPAGKLSFSSNENVTRRAAEQPATIMMKLCYKMEGHRSMVFVCSSGMEMPIRSNSLSAGTLLRFYRRQRHLLSKSLDYRTAFCETGSTLLRESSPKVFFPACAASSGHRTCDDSLLYDPVTFEHCRVYVGMVSFHLPYP